MIEGLKSSGKLLALDDAYGAYADAFLKRAITNPNILILMNRKNKIIWKKELASSKDASQAAVEIVDALLNDIEKAR